MEEGEEGEGVEGEVGLGEVVDEGCPGDDVGRGRGVVVEVEEGLGGEAQVEVGVELGDVGVGC